VLVIEKQRYDAKIQVKNVEYFSYLGIEIINCAKCTSKIKSKIYTTKATFNKKKDLLLRAIFT